MPYDPRLSTEETFTKDTGLPGSALPPGPGYVLDPNGKIVVGDSTYYPSTTNGKLDPFSKTVAVENPTATAANTAQDSPFAVVDQQANTLKQRFAEQFERLQGQNLPPEQHNKILAGMQADYDNEKYKLADVRTQLNGVQSAIDSGVVDPTLGQQTMWKLAAPHMAGAFKPPTEPQPKAALSPGMMAKQEEFMDSFAKNAKVAKGAWSERDPESLIQKYKDYQDVSNYNAFDAGQQKQLDLRWDELMKGTSAYDKWDPTIRADIGALAMIGWRRRSDSRRRGPKSLTYLLIGRFGWGGWIIRPGTGLTPSGPPYGR